MAVVFYYQSGSIMARAMLSYPGGHEFKPRPSLTKHLEWYPLPSHMVLDMQKCIGKVRHM